MRPATFMRCLALYGGMDAEGIPYETPQETLDKAKVRKAVENEESYEVKVEPGTAMPKTAEQILEDSAVSGTPANRKVAETIARVDERESWITSTARILMMEKPGLSKTAARMQAAKEWETSR